MRRQKEEKTPRPPAGPPVGGVTKTETEISRTWETRRETSTHAIPHLKRGGNFKKGNKKKKKKCSSKRGPDGRNSRTKGTEGEL